jgi:hypothetical protein
MGVAEGIIQRWMIALLFPSMDQVPASGVGWRIRAVRVPLYQPTALQRETRAEWLATGQIEAGASMSDGTPRGEGPAVDWSTREDSLSGAALLGGCIKGMDVIRNAKKLLQHF